MADFWEAISIEKQHAYMAIGIQSMILKNSVCIAGLMSTVRTNLGSTLIRSNSLAYIYAKIGAEPLL